MNHAIENLFFLQEFMKSEFGYHYPLDVVYVIIIMFYNLFEIKISCGADHNLLLKNGILHSWGCNNYGQLGLHHRENRNTIQKLDFPLQNVVDISCGADHSMALTSDGKVYDWGYDGSNFPCEVFIPVPVAKIYCGGYHFFAVTTNNKIYSWGSNIYGQLGLGNVEYRSEPCLMENNVLDNLVEISSRYNHCLALNSNGEVYAWGNNNDGRLGLGNTKIRCSPKKVNLEKIIKVNAGCFHSIALNSNGDIYVWGRNNEGQLGLGVSRNQTLPKKLHLSSIKDISCGLHYSIALDECGKLYAWGNNIYGQLGLGHCENQLEPVCLTVTPKNIEKIYCGFYTIITVSDKIYACGKNDSGELGLGHNQHQNLLHQLKF